MKKKTRVLPYKSMCSNNLTPRTTHTVQIHESLNKLLLLNNLEEFL